jgi:hypothetical protein
MADALLKLEAKHGDLNSTTIVKLESAVNLIRMQMLAAQKRRTEVCKLIQSTADPKVPRHHCAEPEMFLTDDEVRFWMRQHREAFEAEARQVARRAHDKYVLKMSARQVEQRQGSRFNGFLKYYFGGSQCLKSYLKDRRCGPRMLPLMTDGDGEPGEQRKPDSKIVLYSNTKNWWVAAAARKRYFEGLVRDLQDPDSELAKQRKTWRFAQLLRRMEDARRGRTYFHDPAPAPEPYDKGEGKGSSEGKGQSKGKDKGKGTIQERWTGQLVAAGLDVGPYTDRRRHQQWWQRQQQWWQQPPSWQYRG